MSCLPTHFRNQTAKLRSKFKVFLGVVLLPFSEAALHVQVLEPPSNLHSQPIQSGPSLFLGPLDPRMTEPFGRLADNSSEITMIRTFLR